MKNYSKERKVELLMKIKSGDPAAIKLLQIQEPEFIKMCAHNGDKEEEERIFETQRALHLKKFYDTYIPGQRKPLPVVIECYEGAQFQLK